MSDLASQGCPSLDAARLRSVGRTKALFGMVIGDSGGDMPWYMYSLATSLSLVGLYLCIKWLTSRGIEPKQILLFMSGFASLGFLGAAAPSLSAVM